MASSVTWIGQSSATVIGNLSGSGVGLFGSAFGGSVNVNEYQDTTWITDSTGASQGSQLNNTKYTNTSGVSINAAAQITLIQTPNYLCPLNIRFTNTTAVKTQNTKLRAYDRSSINNDASGVLVKVAQVIHPWTSQSAALPGSGNSTWTSVFGSGSILSMTSSPGTSGYSPNGTNTTDTQHDYYVSLTMSPNSVSSKTGAFYFYTEFL